MYILKIIAEAAVLTGASSIDVFLAGFSYGTAGIRMPIKSAVVIDAICSVNMCIGIIAARLFSGFIPGRTADIISCMVLCCVGCVKLFDSIIKNLVSKSENKDISFHIMDFRFLLHVYYDSTKADIDASKSISIGESAVLGMAVGADSLATGFGAGFLMEYLPFVFVIAAVLNAVLLISGAKAGKKISDTVKPNITWIGGVMLIILALARIFL